MANNNPPILSSVSNQEGHISPWQKAALRKIRLDYTLRCGAIAGGIFLFCLTVLLGTGGRGFLIPVPLMVLVALAVILFVGYLAKITWQDYTKDIDEDKVASEEGIVGFDIQRGVGRNLIFTLHIGGKKFDLSTNTFLGFKNGEPYRVFFTPRTKKFLSAVALNDENSLNLEKPKHDQVVRLGDDGELIYEDKPKRG